MATSSNILFQDHILASYNQQIRASMPGIKLLNTIAFKNWFYPESFSSPALIGRTPSEPLKEKLYLDALNDLSKTICRGINETYGNKSVNNAVNINDYDIIVAVPLDSITRWNTYKKNILYTDSEEDRKKQQNEKLSKIAGFLIAQKGECAILNDIWSVNLICARAMPTSATDPLSIKGQILMGCYLHAIIMNPNIIDKYGILELAGGFILLDFFHIIKWDLM